MASAAELHELLRRVACSERAAPSPFVGGTSVWTVYKLTCPHQCCYVSAPVPPVPPFPQSESVRGETTSQPPCPGLVQSSRGDPTTGRANGRVPRCLPLARRLAEFQRPCLAASGTVPGCCGAGAAPALRDMATEYSRSACQVVVAQIAEAAGGCASPDRYAAPVGSTGCSVTLCSWPQSAGAVASSSSFGSKY